MQTMATGCIDACRMRRDVLWHARLGVTAKTMTVSFFTVSSRILQALTHIEFQHGANLGVLALKLGDLKS
jgi:hypothetical protein